MKLLKKWNCNFIHMCILIKMGLFNCFLCSSLQHHMMYWNKRTQIFTRNSYSIFFSSVLKFCCTLLHTIQSIFRRPLFHGLFFHTHQHWTWGMYTPWFISALSILVKGANFPENTIWKVFFFSYNCLSHSLQLLLQMI